LRDFERFISGAPRGRGCRNAIARKEARRNPAMLKLGYKLMSEEHGPADLVRNAKRAEESGFAFAAISDHFSPWLEEQGHAPLAWPVLGAIANATRRMGLMTAVTCPTMAPANA
jgi:alkanesulfonate monooxygenase SsuD/methylene tetrahydromethanopterin reductase-like flavin-dependent oxidoreductase (luciferase family)